MQLTELDREVWCLVVCFVWDCRLVLIVYSTPAKAALRTVDVNLKSERKLEKQKTLKNFVNDIFTASALRSIKSMILFLSVCSLRWKTEPRELLTSG